MLIITLLFITLRFLVVLCDFLGATDPKARSRLEWEDEIGTLLNGLSSISSFEVIFLTTGFLVLMTIFVPSSVNMPTGLTIGMIFFFSIDKFLLPNS